MEWYYINKIDRYQSFYSLVNIDKRHEEPSISELDKPIVEKIIQGINIFLLFCNIDLNILEQKGEKEKFWFGDGELIYSSGKFILLKNSKINHPSYQKNRTDKSRVDRWFEENENYLQKIGENNWTLTRDVTIKSPSFAGRLCSGKSSENGWIVWKNKEEKSLDAIYRKMD